jgi:hypothetical protein
MFSDFPHSGRFQPIIWDDLRKFCAFIEFSLPFKLKLSYIHTMDNNRSKWLNALILVLFPWQLWGQSQALSPPVFSYQRGFYQEPFAVVMISKETDAQVYYTTDGSEPGEDNGFLYSTPIEITTTTVLRARSVKSGSLPSHITTHTYLFLEDVIAQPNDPPGYPAQWGPYTAIPGNAIADYEMDPEITQDPQYAVLLKDALLSLPTMSLVTNRRNLFSHSTDPDTGGIYIYTGPPENNDIPGLGDGWERPASLELITSDSAQEFQVDCGVRIQGGHSRRAEKSAKHSFRVVFKSKYGPKKLEYPIFGDTGAKRFNTLTLRAGFGNTWNHWRHSERRRAQYERDVWAKETLRSMGHHSGHGFYVHLYLNGLYWGLYNPTERIDREYAESYLGGDAMDYDVIKDYAEVVDGSISTWNEMMQLANRGLADDADYQRILGNNPDGSINPDYEAYIDMVNFIDYMILNFYGGNWDWDHHNWVAVRNRVQPSKGFIFLSWDAEHILEELSENILDENNNNCPSRLFQQLRENQTFRRLFADRVQLHCFNGGVLTPAAVEARWMRQAEKIELAIIAESARWGDYRRDVHPYDPSGPFDLYTKTYWLSEQSYLLDDYFPNRTDAFINQLKQAALLPNISAPILLINDQPITDRIINKGDVLIMTAASGDIYYTTDSSDPLLPPSSAESNQFTLFSEDTEKRVLVPKTDIGSTWRSDISFDDSEWQICSGAPGGVGYEINSGYQDLITRDVADDMYENGSNPNTSCYIRILFAITKENLSDIKSLILQARYDDGFVAYLNNVKIADVNAPVTPSWNSAATGTHEATSAESFNISKFITALTEGENLLAIQAMNTGISSSDFIFNAALTASDQAGMTGSISPNAIIYTEPVILNQSTHIKARTFDGSGWSAATDMIFIIPEELYNLKITEIHYHPLPQDSIDDRSFEFIELKNTGYSALDLSGLRFCEGIAYTFPLQTLAKPGEFIVLASNRIRFAQRYGFIPAGQYDGQLDNAGERITLINATVDTLISLRYNDRDPWPVVADGAGYSLVPKELHITGDPNDPANWLASDAVHGSPGKDDRATTFVEMQSSSKPVQFQLRQNYPNPFNNTTMISYQLPVTGDVELSIYNLLGQKIALLVSEKQQTGRYQVEWHADGFASGLYFYRLQMGKREIHTKKMLLIR